MNIRKKKVLVTGAGGFIGSHLTEELVRMGADVRAFVHYNSFNSWGWLETSDEQIRNSVQIVAGDVRDPFGVANAVRGCDVILHLAALIAIPYSYRSPAAYVETNINGTLNIVEAAKQSGVEKVLITSTSETYGTAVYAPIDEKHPLQGQSPYSASKIGADQIALAYHRSFDTPVSVIRPFNTYGPRQSARAVIPTIITQIANGALGLKLGDLSPTRDFTYVEDTVNGFIRVAESDASLGEVINIGSGFEMSIGDTARLIAELMGSDAAITSDLERMRPEKSEVRRLVAGNNKAGELTGWSPRYAGLDGFRTGIEKTIRWFEKPENLGRYKARMYNV